jgi:pimeloyl-ACP methyl ester carboxylesterase
VTSRPLPFFSSGLRLDADLHLPEKGAAGGQRAPYPVVVACSGYQGQTIIHPERFARALNPLGYAVLAFDYRGFGLSEGERGRLVPQEWAEDIRAGIDRLGTVADVDLSRLALAGWGLGGGVVVTEAVEDPRVRAVACLNGIADGTRSTRNMHDEASWADLLRRIEADRGHRSSAGRSEIADPWDIVRLNLDGRTDGYVGAELYKAPGFGSGVTLESAEFLLRFSPERVVARLAPRPLLIVHGAQNALHKPVEAQSMYDHAAEPKRLELLEGCGHTEWMFDDNPTFTRVVGLLDEFLTGVWSLDAGRNGRGGPRDHYAARQ